MIPTKVVREKTGLTTRQLKHLRTLHLIPKTTMIPSTGGRGPTFAYPATVLNRIRLIKILQAKGISLNQMAKHARGTPFECPHPGPSPDRKVAP